MQTQTIHANGLDFAYYESGSGDRLVMCLHGFPDTADTWSALMPALANAGYRVIAPFMRGYPPTDISEDAQYGVHHLAQDVISLIEAFGAESAIVIGHDWGALTAYAAAALAPERISQLVTVAIPHPRTLRFNLKTILKARHFLTFQLRGMTINWMKRNNFAALETIYRRWSPNWKFTEADIAPVRESLAQPGGVEGALGYYWSMIRERQNPDIHRLTASKTAVPTLAIFGDADGALSMDALEYTHKAFTDDYQQVVLPDVGHFLHREVPDHFAELVLNFIN